MAVADDAGRVQFYGDIATITGRATLTEYNATTNSRNDTEVPGWR